MSLKNYLKSKQKESIFVSFGLLKMLEFWSIMNSQYAVSMEQDLFGLDMSVYFEYSSNGIKDSYRQSSFNKSIGRGGKTDTQILDSSIELNIILCIRK